MSRKNRETDYAAELENSFTKWDELFKNGGSDPFWADGANLNLVRNHIIYYKEQLAKQENTLFGLPEIYYRETPPEIDCNSTGCRTVSPKGGARTRRQQSETGYIGAP